MPNPTEGAALLSLIKEKKFTLLAYTYDLLEEPVKDALKSWLLSRNMPNDTPTDAFGTEYVLAWYDDNYKIFVFDLSVEEEEQCAGSVVFSLEGNTCTFLFDNVKCSD